MWVGTKSAVPVPAGHRPSHPEDYYKHLIRNKVFIVNANFLSLLRYCKKYLNK